MQHPIININGDNKATLEREAMAAVEAMQGAINAVNAMTCHGRNYPCQASYYQATQDFGRILNDLVKIGEELVTYHIEIAVQ
jgi:hypothetical protein